MKRLVILSVLLTFCFAMTAQHKPLKQINLNDIYISQSGAEKSYNSGSTREIYSSFFHLGSSRVSHYKGIKSPDMGYDAWTINVALDNNDAIALNSYANMNKEFDNFYSGSSALKLEVGETHYEVNIWYYSDISISTTSLRTLMIDINKSIAEHISISGLQGIFIDNIEIIAFSDIDQELWRRAAKDVYNTRKNL